MDTLVDPGEKRNVEMVEYHVNNFDLLLHDVSKEEMGFGAFGGYLSVWKPLLVSILLAKCLI
jgi:hypothetical protein